MKKLFFIILMIGLLRDGYSQQNVVKGSVYAFNNLALLHIQVSAKNSKAVVCTDSMGCFTIVCADKDRLTFKGHGFETVSKKVNVNDSVRVKMVFKQGAKNEEIAVGYGHLSKDKLTNAIAHWSAYNNDYCTYNDIFALIQAKFGSVQVVSYSGTRQIIVRGTTTITGNSGAIYVVDGIVVNDISNISPSQVKSIDILKDASASIYGSQGANGAVIICTLNGKP